MMMAVGVTRRNEGISYTPGRMPVQWGSSSGKLMIVAFRSSGASMQARAMCVSPGQLSERKNKVEPQVVQNPLCDAALD